MWVSHHKRRKKRIKQFCLWALVGIIVIAVVFFATRSVSPAPEAVSQTPVETQPKTPAAIISPEASDDTTSHIIDPDGMTVKTRFNTPEGYIRTQVNPDSFAQYLRDLPLKKDGEPVLYFDGREKNNSSYIAAVDQPISDKNRHQCADAIIRLRAQYLFMQERYDEIKFHFVDGFLCDYITYRAGSRIKLQDDKPIWVKSAEPDAGEEVFARYLEIVYAYASTISLEKELESVDAQDMQIGDVFIIGGSPGHAVIVVDMAENAQGEKCFMLAQSYMPAQQTEILRNPNNDELSPWYPLNFGQSLATPQWTFSREQLKRFP